MTLPTLAGASDEQARIDALDPARSILLQAPAGSGKTTVLAQRYLRLLANVDEPEQILAITFTRKAAAEMRARVLQALAAPPEGDDTASERWRQLRTAALANAATHGWTAAELAARLRIQTIDSVNHEIARSMPVLAGVGGPLDVVDDARELHTRAARRTLVDAATLDGLAADMDRLFRRLDNSWRRVEELLAAMLADRARWLPTLLESDPDALGGVVERGLARIVAEVLSVACSRLGTPLLHEAEALARASARNREEAGLEPGDWQAFCSDTARLDTSGTALPAWRAVVELALTGEGGFRQRIDRRQGFPAAGKEAKALKERWQAWVADLQADGEHLRLLRMVRLLPSPHVAPDERQAIAALARVLLLAVQELKLEFRAAGRVDHAEVAATARQALVQEGDPSELGLARAARLQHLLVDEFQDTSADQLRLLEALTADWQPGDGRSIFLVGDPMQSIYLFRSAEVSLFLQARDRGIGTLPLEFRELRRNFRSNRPVVDWVNGCFSRVFPATEDLRRSAVRFLAAQAHRDGGPDPAVHVLCGDAASAEEEIPRVADAVAEVRRGQPAARIAVLLQTRALAGDLLAALQARDVPTLGIELAPLASQPAVLDLLALAGALDHAADRAAWLAVLRAPFCGLTLADLHALAADDRHALLPARLGDAACWQALSTDGQQRLARCAPVLLDALERRGREPLADALARTWLRLGGPAACAREEDVAQARLFLDALRRREAGGQPLDAAAVRTLAGSLRAGAGGNGANPVEVLTIHHSKGLEWDVVFVPGLGMTGRRDDSPLLWWLELPAPGGAQDLLLSALSIGVEDPDESLPRYIRFLQSERQENERCRLAYVAATRARQALYLSGCVTRERETGAPRPAANSLLETLWPALEPDFVAWAAAQPATPTAGGDGDGDGDGDRARTAAAAPSPVPPPFLRLPAGWALPLPSSPPAVQALRVGAQPSEARPEYSWVGRGARAAGTVVHAALERAAEDGLPDDAMLETRRPDYERRLRELGITGREAGEAAQRVVGVLARLRDDATLSWILSRSHRWAATELRLTGWHEGRLRSIAIDRCFVDADGQRWVIDYKTSTHEGAGLADFLQEEVRRYAAQLRLYRALASRLGPEPVRAALYFPLLRTLREASTQDLASSGLAGK